VYVYVVIGGLHRFPSPDAALHYVLGYLSTILNGKGRLLVVDLAGTHNQCNRLNRVHTGRCKLLLLLLMELDPKP
jgi:hypothetical protein